MEPSTSPSTNVTVPVGNTKFPSPMDGSPHRNGRINTGYRQILAHTASVRTYRRQNISQPAYTPAAHRVDRRDARLSGYSREQLGFLTAPGGLARHRAGRHPE